ncbi:MAG: nucleotidyltransferase domain-containing protein [Paludibacter sp.]|nr:nucleotidyltransferase domain-containing protein [Paludibacter sp.]
MYKTGKEIDIPVGQLETVKQILKKHLPSGMQIWVFGSRATGTAKEYSDLDIALQPENGQKLEVDLMVKLMDNFVESNLPFKVDVIDYNAASGIFKQNVDSQKIKLTR